MKKLKEQFVYVLVWIYTVRGAMMVDTFAYEDEADLCKALRYIGRDKGVKLPPRAGRECLLLKLNKKSSDSFRCDRIAICPKGYEWGK